LKKNAREGAGSVTLGIDLGNIKTILPHTAAVHGVAIGDDTSRRSGSDGATARDFIHAVSAFAARKR